MLLAIQNELYNLYDTAWPHTSAPWCNTKPGAHDEFSQTLQVHRHIHNNALCTADAIQRRDCHKCWTNGDVWSNMHIHPCIKMSKHGVEAHDIWYIDFSCFFDLHVALGVGTNCCEAYGCVWNLDMKPFQTIWTHFKQKIEHSQHKEQEIVQNKYGQC